MARRTFDVIDVAEILVHWVAGRRTITRSIQPRAVTVTDDAPVVTPGHPGSER
jgi:hypothetical protein